MTPDFCMYMYIVYIILKCNCCQPVYVRKSQRGYDSIVLPKVLYARVSGKTKMNPSC